MGIGSIAVGEAKTWCEPPWRGELIRPSDILECNMSWIRQGWNDWRFLPLGIGRLGDCRAQRSHGSTDGDSERGIGSVPWSGMEEAFERCGSKGRLGCISRHLYGVGSDAESSIEDGKLSSNKIYGAAALVIKSAPKLT